MQILKYFTLVVFVSALSLSCANRLPTTPKDAFSEVKRAYEKKDTKRLLSLYTSGTIGSLYAAVTLINAMDEAQHLSLAEKGMIPRSKSITAEDLIRHQIETAKKSGDDPQFNAFTRAITSISTKDTQSVIRTDDGIELKFYREGSYWKFSPEGK
jgi:hypothetical protein